MAMAGLTGAGGLRSRTLDATTETETETETEVETADEGGSGAVWADGCN